MATILRGIRFLQICEAPCREAQQSGIVQGGGFLSPAKAFPKINGFLIPKIMGSDFNVDAPPKLWAFIIEKSLHHRSLTVRQLNKWRVSWRRSFPIGKGTVQGLCCLSSGGYIPCVILHIFWNPTPPKAQLQVNKKCQTNHPKNCKHRASRVRFGSDYHSNLKMLSWDFCSKRFVLIHDVSQKNGPPVFFTTT